MAKDKDARLRERTSSETRSTITDVDGEGHKWNNDESAQSMKVLLVSPSYGTNGGVQVFCRTIVEWFPIPIDVFFVGPRSIQEGALKRALRSGRDVLRFGLTLIRKDYDIIHINTSLDLKSLIREGSLLLVSRLCNTPVVVYFHGWSPQTEGSIRGFWKLLFRLVFSRADCFVVLASDFRDSLAGWGFSVPVHIESTFVDDSIVKYVTEETNGGDASLPPRGASINLLFLSRVIKEKGVCEAIEAYGLLKRRFPSLTLTVAGSGDHLEESRDLVRRMQIPDVRFAGFVEGRQKARTFLEADIFLFPSYYGEGMPIAVLEAMMCGLPVVTRRLGGIKDFFQEGIMGFSTDSREPKVIAELLEQLIADAAFRERVARHNSTYAKDHFLASSAAKRLHELYKSMAGIMCMLGSGYS